MKTTEETIAELKSEIEERDIQLAIKNTQSELLYEAASLNDVLLSALKLCYERVTSAGYANAGISTDELILIEKAISAADPSYKAPAL